MRTIAGRAYARWLSMTTLAVLVLGGVTVHAASNFWVPHLYKFNQGNPNQTVLDDYYSLDGHLGSSPSTTTYDPTRVIGTCYANTNCLEFSGGSQFAMGDHVTIPHDNSVTNFTNGFRLQAFIKPDVSTQHYQAIVDKYFYDSSTGNSHGFTVYLTGGVLRVSVYSGAAGTRNLFVNTAGDLRTGSWYYIEVHFDPMLPSNNLMAEVFSVPNMATNPFGPSLGTNQTTWTNPMSGNTQPIGIGLRIQGWGGYMPFAGQMDEVFLYKLVSGGSGTWKPHMYELDSGDPAQLLRDYSGHMVGYRGDSPATTTFDPTRVVGGCYEGTSCLDFGGGSQFSKGDHATIPHDSTMDFTHGFRLSAYIKPDPVYHHYLAIVDKYFYDSATGNSHGFTVYLTGGVLRVSVYSGAAGTRNLFVNSAGDLRTGNWYSIEVHFDPSLPGNNLMAEVFAINNIITQPWGPKLGGASTTWSQPLSGNTRDIGIGMRLQGWGGYLPFSGQMDQVYLYEIDP